MSLDTKNFYKIVEETKKRIQEATTLSDSEKERIRVAGYGHIGDGNIHLNVAIPGYDDKEL